MDHKMLITGQDEVFLDPALFEPEGVVLLKGNGPSVENVASDVFDDVRILETENNIFAIEKSVVV